MPTPPSRQIEAIEPDARHPDIVRIVVGGRTVMTAPREALASEGLAVGDTLSEGHQARLGAVAELSAARRTALACLERRSFARRDLARRLVLKGHRAPVVDAALRQLEEAGLLSDSAFAKYYVESRSQRGRGPARLRKELLRLGVDAEHIEAAIASQALEPADVSTAIEKLVAGRLSRLAGLPRSTVKRRLLAFLARRGYTGPSVLEVVRKQLGG